MIKNYNNFRNIVNILLIIVSNLQPCLASLETKDKQMSDLVLDDKRVQENLLPKNIKQQEFLPESLEITRLMGIARLLYYSSKQFMSQIQHPLAKNLNIIFEHFDQSSDDIKNLAKAVEELKRILYNVEDTTYPDGTLTQTYFFRILLILAKYLTAPAEKKLLHKYLTNPFLIKNFVLEKWYDRNQKINMALNFSRSIEILQLTTNIPQRNVFDSELMFDSLYPKYLYFSVKKNNKKQYLDLTKEYQFEYIDQHKVCLYKLVGLLIREDRKVYSILYENKRWNRYINDKRLSKYLFIPCPLMVMFEKYAEFYRKTS